VGTGRSLRVGDGLEHLIALSGREVVVVVSPALADARGPADVRADIGRIVTQTDWRPEVGWEQSLDDLWVAARRSVRRLAIAIARGAAEDVGRRS
jgi:GDP-4-dehydro-6-deoxy-D-mannose reductase